MIIETITQDDTNKSQIIIDDTIDLTIEKIDDKYIINILENNCFDVEVNMINESEVK